MHHGPAELSDPSRLSALQRTDLLDRPAEASFDRLVRLAAKLLDAPVALVSLVEEDRQFFAGCIGLPEPWASWRQTPLTHSFCQHVVTSGEPLLIEDARRHPLVKDNAAIDDLSVIAYAGVPLRDSQGALLGSFCVIDTVPRQWTPEQVDWLRDISASVVSEIELRLSLRQAEARQREAEQERRLRTAVLESASEGIYGIDRELRCTFVNPAAAQMLGYRPDELLGRNMHHLIHNRYGDGSEYPEERCPIATAAREGVSLRLDEEVLWRKDGTCFYAEYAASPIVENGLITGSVVTFRDISERRQAEKALSQSQRRLQMLFENAQDGILLADDNAQYVDANPAACALTGYSCEELLQRSVWDITPLPDRKAGAMLWQEFIAAGKQAGEYTLTRKDGGTVAVEYRAVANILPGLHLSVLRDVSERRRAEAALRASEERATAIIDSIADGFVAMDRQWRLTYMNLRAEEVLRPTYGWTKQEMLGKCLWDLFPETLGTPIEENYRRAVRDGVPVNFEVFFPPLKGWFLLRAYPSRDGLSVYFLDISDRKRAEEALRVSEQRFRQLADAMPQMVWTARPDGLVEYYNERWYAYTGLPRGKIGDASWEPAMMPEDLPIIHQAWDAALASGEPYDVEYRVRRASDGLYRWHVARALPVRDSGGRIVRWFGTITDIDDQKRAAELLAEATALAQRNAAELEALIEAMPHGVYFGNEQGITRCNQYALRLLGASSLEELRAQIGELGRRFSVSYRDEPDRLVEPEHLPFVRALRGDSASLDTWITKFDGSGRVCVRGTAAPVYEDGRIIGAVAVNTDITDSVHDDQAIREARDAAERASNAKSEFLATLSHELRTPLTPVLLTVSLMESHPQLPGDLRDDLATIRRNVELESRLISDLLDLTRIENNKLELDEQEVDLHLVIRSAVDICRREASARLEVDLKAQRHVVRGDSTRLQQVFWNLINNAIKFTPSDGTITVRSSNPEDGRVRIEVIDTGVGIDPAVLPKLFTAFEQGYVRAERQQAGLGLGLAISKRLVEMHGGTISASSQGRGQGATFVVEFPAVHVFAVPPVAQPPQPTTAVRPLRVLLVEDHEMTLRVMRRLLRGMGHRVTGTTSVASATAAAAQEQFDLMICDLGLPDGSGLDVMRQLRGVFEGRAVAVTGYGMESDIAASREAGFAEHLTKPVDLAALQAAIERLTAPSQPPRADS